MNILVTDIGFSSVEDDITPLTADTPIDEVDLSSDLIAISFPSFADGRGFSLAAALRRRGFKGRLRAKGHVLADQYAMARRVGFDEVEISQELAARQDEAQWRARANWKNHDYQSKLGQKR